MNVSIATDQASWDAFLSSQKFRPFLQSWTMGEVYQDCNQPPIRLVAHEGNTVVGICQALVVPARRGKHLSVPYGPIVSTPAAVEPLLNTLEEEAKKQNCWFVRLSPFWETGATISNTKPAPLHLLAEHLWYLPLMEQDAWETNANNTMRDPEEVLMDMRKTTRNLVRRAGRDGVTIERSSQPLKDLPKFIELHEETRKRHNFTPYTNEFFAAQVRNFSERDECSLYLAHYEHEVIASSVIMHPFGETSYHHGASTHKHSKVPASYLMQWTAIQDAMSRQDRVYNFWGISPEGVKNHPFAGVRTFKTGFGGKLLELTHCMDRPIHSGYHLTRAVEQFRKWRRGF